jgi:lysophospholipase L1-like esterase
MTAVRKLCFIGDSLIEYYDWQARFPNQEVVNLGVAGETAPELLARVSRLTDTSYRPDGVVIMIGTNDLLQGLDPLPSVEATIKVMRTLWPEALLLVNGLMPMNLPWLPPNLISQTNARLEELALRHKIGYLDGCHLLPSSSASPSCFLDDGVHLSQHGYTLWSAAIENHLCLTGCI